MIRLHRLDHVCLRVADLDEASARWQLQFALVERSRDGGRALLACNDEPYCLELVEAAAPGHDHYAFELAPDCSLDDARAHFDDLDVAWDEREGSLFLADPDGRLVQVMPYRVPASEADRRPQHARPSTTVHLGGARQARPRQLPHGRHPGRRPVLHRRARDGRLRLARRGRASGSTSTPTTT